MKDRIECPFGTGEAVLKKEERSLIYRKEEFKVIAHYYKCEDCGEEFTTNEADHITLIQAHNQYREKNGIPFPEEIKRLRETYGLSAKKMSEVFRLGENGYGNYEKGEIASPAIGTFIKAAEVPEIFLSLLEDHHRRSGDKQIGKAITIAKEIIERKNKDFGLFKTFPVLPLTNNYTGYTQVDPRKIEQLLIHYIHECSEEYNDKLKLSKLLFFTDFCHYREFGQSVSGLSYQNLNIGPLPTCTDGIFNYFERNHKINQHWEIIQDGKAREIFQTSLNGEIYDIFNAEERLTIDHITLQYKNTPTADLVEKSNNLVFKSSGDSKDDLIGFQENAFA